MLMHRLEVVTLEQQAVIEAMATNRDLAVASTTHTINNRTTLLLVLRHTTLPSRLITGKPVHPRVMAIRTTRRFRLLILLPLMLLRVSNPSLAANLSNHHILLSPPVPLMGLHMVKRPMSMPNLRLNGLSKIKHTLPTQVVAGVAGIQTIEVVLCLFRILPRTISQFLLLSRRPPPPSNYGSNNRGHGRGSHAHSHRGAHIMNNDRSEKFRQRDQKPHQPFNHQKSDPAAAKKKKRKTNTLGLTPGDDNSDDDVDEEKRLEELLGTDAPGIPDGDLAKWIAARKENFPTQARIAKKKEAAMLVKQEPEANEIKEPIPPKVDPVEKEADRLRRRLAKLDRKLEKRKRAPNDEGDELRSESSDEESDDDKPEALPTNQPSAGFLPPPPITRADPTNHCKYYSTGGICGKKGKCRFVHDPAVREAALQERTRNGGRMTLKQRLLLNDKEQEDMEVIKTIVEMRVNGRLHDPQNSSVPADRQVKQEAAVAAVSSLPTIGGEANLPPNPYAHLKNADRASQFRKPKKRNDWPVPVPKYPGWNP
ncbi:hypothetical protein Hte_004999 [Hypoxylon texense]